MTTYDKYIYLIKKGTFTEEELIFFRKYINQCSPLPIEKINHLHNLFKYKASNRGIKLTKEQSQKGINWLKQTTFKLDGSLRKNPVLGSFEQSVVKNFSKFLCIGLYNLSSYSRQYVPIYRCIAKKGNYFDYICKMWGEIEVISVGSVNTRK